MDLAERRVWGAQHKVLNGIILKPQEHARAIELFLSLHAWLYTSEAGNTGELTLEDELLITLDERTFRKYPVIIPNTKNSIAWHLWHIARIEDMTMNILIADDQQVLYTGNWFESMNTIFAHSGNDMSQEDIAELSLTLNLESLLAYRIAVGRQTRQIIASLKPGQLKEKIEPNRIKRLFAESAVTENSSWLADYWSRKKRGWTATNACNKTQLDAFK